MANARKNTKDLRMFSYLCFIIESSLVHFVVKARVSQRLDIQFVSFRVKHQKLYKIIQFLMLHSKINKINDLFR